MVKRHTIKLLKGVSGQKKLKKSSDIFRKGLNPGMNINHCPEIVSRADETKVACEAAIEP